MCWQKDISSEHLNWAANLINLRFQILFFPFLKLFGLGVPAQLFAVGYLPTSNGLYSFYNRTVANLIPKLINVNTEYVIRSRHPTTAVERRATVVDGAREFYFWIEKKSPRFCVTIT